MYAFISTETIMSYLLYVKGPKSRMYQKKKYGSFSHNNFHGILNSIALVDEICMQFWKVQ